MSAKSSKLAAFPLAVLKQQKYWPPVARVWRGLLY